MNERLLQYIWQFQYFNKNNLETTAGEELYIIRQGTLNANQGPDFLEAKIRIGKHIWAGNVELHVNASDWHQHLHALDPNYRNVILHVVWNDDDPFPRHEIPTLVLADRISKLLLQQYAQWMNSGLFIPCGRHIPLVEEIIVIKWKERLLIERLQRKFEQVKQWLEQSNYHWEEVFWWMLARNFGLYINAEAFEELAKSIPYNILLKHRNNLSQLEAILLGQAGLIQDEDQQKEYNFLAKKYKLQKIVMPFHLLRMRPASFPMPRIRQLAAIIHNHCNLFSLALNAGSLREIKQVFSETVIINTIAPILFAYGICRIEEKYLEKAIDLIHYTSAEKNSITLQFKKLEIANKSAADSQALIELKTQYCDKRRCLDCAIGNTIFKRKA